MASKNEENCKLRYDELCEYISVHKHLPDKHKETDRNKLSWWKSQMKKKKVGKLTEEQEQLLQILADSRSTEHTGGRRKRFDNAENK